MAGRVFIPQPSLERWIDRGEATFEGNEIRILQKGLRYEVEPAIRILGVIEGEDQGLVGKLIALSRLSEFGAEHFRDSLIIGDNAYSCEEGFVETKASQAAKTEAPKAAPPEPAAPTKPQSIGEAVAANQGEDTNKNESEMLADFLLKHL